MRHFSKKNLLFTSKKPLEQQFDSLLNVFNILSHLSKY